MNYIEIEIQGWRKEKNSLPERVLKRLLPSENPDLENLYKRASFWWLEFDDNGCPQREIGFDRNRKPIVLGPVGKNSGFLVDSADDWRDFKEPNSEAEVRFESVWCQLWPSFVGLETIS
jgi:hypothetical protein